MICITQNVVIPLNFNLPKKLPRFIRVSFHLRFRFSPMQTQPPAAVYQQLALSKWKWKGRDFLPLVQISSLSLSKVCCLAMTTKAAHIQIHWWAGRLSSKASCRLKALSNHFCSTSMTLWDLFRQRHNHEALVRPHLHRKVPVIASFIHVNNGPFLQIEPPIAVLLTFNLIFKVQKLAFFLLRNISIFKFWFMIARCL